MKERVHIIPLGDVAVHYAQVTCWCHPIIITLVETDRGDICTHNAKDCREAIERQTGKSCSEGWVTLGEMIDTEQEARLKRMAELLDLVPYADEHHPLGRVRPEWEEIKKKMT